MFCVFRNPKIINFFKNVKHTFCGLRVHKLIKRHSRSIHSYWEIDMFRCETQPISDVSQSETALLANYVDTNQEFVYIFSVALNLLT